VISLARQKFLVPDRAGMPEPSKYASVVMPGGEHRVAGSTEATRGCKHLCRHCPIVPVYNGAFRVVRARVVLEDIRQQVAAGARHITFGDPDFFNGPSHAISIVEAMHREFPELTYDVTIKIEHLRKQDALLPALRDTGCLFVTSAVESVDDAVLEKFDKGHTRADFLAVAARFRELGMTLLPTFVPFTPWTTLEGYSDLLGVLAQESLTENVAPIQLAIRLLIPAGSRLLELPEVARWWVRSIPRRSCFPGSMKTREWTLSRVKFLSWCSAAIALNFRARKFLGTFAAPQTRPPEIARRTRSRILYQRARRCRISMSPGIAAPSRWTFNSCPSGK
jgi:hypothetical protein